MFTEHGSVKMGEHDEEKLWSIRCDGVEIATLLLNPVYWITVVGRRYPQLDMQLADLSRHPDVSIVFNYPYGKSHYAEEADHYVVEGIGTTNLITVRAPHRLNEQKQQEACTEIKRRSLPSGYGHDAPPGLLGTTGELSIAIRPEERLGYFHFELAPHDLHADNLAVRLNHIAQNIFAIVTNPQHLLDTLNAKVAKNDYKLFLIDDRTCDFVVANDKGGRVHFAPIDAVQREEVDTAGNSDVFQMDVSRTSKISSPPATCTSAQLQIIVQANVHGTATCACIKGSGNAICLENAGGGCEVYCIATNLAGIYCYSPPPPG